MADQGGRQSRRILLVEDDETLRERLARALRARGQDVVTAADRTSALAAAEFGLQAAMVDLKLGSQSGWTSSATSFTSAPECASWSSPGL